jgi:hypothetical protein
MLDLVEQLGIEVVEARLPMVREPEAELEEVVIRQRHGAASAREHRNAAGVDEGLGHGGASVDQNAAGALISQSLDITRSHEEQQRRAPPILGIGVDDGPGHGWATHVRCQLAPVAVVNVPGKRRLGQRVLTRERTAGTGDA